MSFFKDQLIGVLYVDDFDACVNFYENKLGLKRVSEWNRGPENRGVKVAVVGGGYLEIVDKKVPLPQGPTSLWMEAKDINGVYSSLEKTPGTNIFETIEDKYYHARSFQLKDPDGNGIFVVAYDEDVKPYTCDAEKGDYFKDEFRTVFFVEDLDACYRFYTETLELPSVYQWDEGPGDRGFKYRTAGTGAYIETLHRIPLTKQGSGTAKIEAKDVDACYEAICAKPGIRFVSQLADTSWGTRQFSILDPNDNEIIIFSYE